MKRILTSLLLTLLVPGLVLEADLTKAKYRAAAESGSADEQAVINLIKKMENDRVQAGVRKDVEAISAATAEEYVQIDFDGRLMNRETTFQRIKSSEIQLKSNSPEDMVVRIYANTAVVTGRAAPKGTINGKDFGGPIRYSRVYVKRDGRWQVVLFQQTRIAQDK